MSKDNTKVQSMLEHMGRSVEELRSSETWMQMLKVQARFHRYSASNMLMILMQKPHATKVAGYRQWQGMNRQVMKGEKAIKIFAPMTKKDKDTETTKLIGFKLVSVFDISQTEGEPLPTLEWPEAESCPPGLLAELIEHTEGLGLKVHEGSSPHPMAPGARGWYQAASRSIHLVDASEAGLAATLLHEVGHALDPELDADTDRARRELVAESVSYILGLHYGIKIEAEVEHYLASWGADVDSLLAVMDRIKAALDAWEGKRAERIEAA